MNDECRVRDEQKGVNNGMVIVEWIVLHHPAIALIVVHSTNNGKRNEMVARLRKAGYLVVENPMDL